VGFDVEYDWRVTRVSDGAITHHSVPLPAGAQPSSLSPVVFSDDSGTTYLQHYDAAWATILEAVDVSSWATKWSRETTFFTTDTNLLDRATGYFKVGLHEPGHGLGLDHLPLGVHGKTVMNALGHKDDQDGNVPNDITTCDRNAAKAYSIK